MLNLPYNIKLVGALTSKPYAFAARSWELKNTETIDIFESLCSNIRIDVKGSEIMRVLPINNEAVNEEWISDKTRFAYDSLNRWRFINPMIRKGGFFTQTSWEEAFKHIEEKVKTEKFDNYNISTGNFVDLEQIATLQKFSEKFNNVTVNSDVHVNLDLQNHIISDLDDIDGNKVFIIAGCNLKQENPILNIKLRKISKMPNVLIGYIGSKYDYNLDAIHLGNSVEVLKKIVEGKHAFSTLIESFLKKDLKGKYVETSLRNKVSLIVGNEFNSLYDNHKFTGALQRLESKFQLETLYKHTGQINASELGLFTNKTINNSNMSNNLIYLVGTDICTTRKDGDFVIYQGFHNDTIRDHVDVILPSVTWTEKSTLYMNSLGMIQKTNFVNLPPENSRVDWKISKMLSIFLGQDIGFKSIGDIHNTLNQMSPNITNNIAKPEHLRGLKLPFNKSSKFATKSYVQRTPFKPLTSGYYLTNSTERASKVMLKCHNILDKKNNFLK